MSSIIYWFSGTGNSLYTAKKLADAIGNTDLAPISSGIPPEAVGGDGCKIGFVFPSYYGELPRLVRAFINDLNILPGTDLFAIVTMGAFGQGSIKALDDLFTAKGLVLRYGVGVRINGNYILNYDPAIFGAKSDRRMSSKLNKADKQIRQIAEKIINGKQKIKKNNISAKTLYKDIVSLDSGFVTNDKCTGCGLCERVCPVNNIKIIEDRPIWQHHCEHCVACISWCPTTAINYGQATEKRTRYRNPHIKVTELENVRAPTPVKSSYDIQPGVPHSAI